RRCPLQAHARQRHRASPARLGQGVSGPVVNRDWNLLVGGDGVTAASAYDIIDPATEAVVGRAPGASAQQARDAWLAARAAQTACADTAVDRRCELADPYADLWDRHADELVPLVMADPGATIRVA